MTEIVLLTEIELLTKIVSELREIWVISIAILFVLTLVLGCIALKEK